MKAANRRIADRKDVDVIEITDLTSLSDYEILVRQARIVDTSTSGLLLEVERKHLVPKNLRENLSLQEIKGLKVAMFLPQMNLDLDGTITRADHIGKGKFEVGIQFSDEVPLYWRECLVELMPAPGEIDS